MFLWPHIIFIFFSADVILTNVTSYKCHSCHGFCLRQCYVTSHVIQCVRSLPDSELPAVSKLFIFVRFVILDSLDELLTVKGNEKVTLFAFPGYLWWARNSGTENENISNRAVRLRNVWVSLSNIFKSNAKAQFPALLRFIFLTKLTEKVPVEKYIKHTKFLCDGLIFM